MLLPAAKARHSSPPALGVVTDTAEWSGARSVLQPARRTEMSVAGHASLIIQARSLTSPGAQKLTPGPNQQTGLPGNALLFGMKTNALPLDPIPLDAEAINRAGEMLRALPRGSCCWPCGDPRDAYFRWCGRAAAPGSVYCDTHRAEVQNPGPDGARIDLDSLLRRLKRR